MSASHLYEIRQERWSESDETAFSRFIAELGESGCNTVDRCLHDSHNPFRGNDPPGTVFASDCADLPYVLRFYFAWKRGLPFSYQAEVEPRGRARDMRYSPNGNQVTRRVVPTGEDGYRVLDQLRDDISSASYRLHPELEAPEQQDFYSPALTEKSIRAGTVIYDPNGHLAVIWKVEKNGRIHYLDAHPDSSVTRGFYDMRFVRASPGMGAGFKNWRPQMLKGARRQPDGTLSGGSIALAPNKDISDFSLEQFFGNGPRLGSDRLWAAGRFTLNGEDIGYYDYLRGRLAGGALRFDPLREIADMVASNCDDLQYRVQAVDMAVDAGLARQSPPERLPLNIYGTEGDWETYSTPSRDARLKTAFKELFDAAKRFLSLAQQKNGKLAYKGTTPATDMLAAYDAQAARCRITYTNSKGDKISFGYEEARRRLFDFSFDPYHCPERRWGAKGTELATCPDNREKAAWYAAEKNLRNQIDRSYEVRMDFSREELQTSGPGKGQPNSPETDVRSFLVWQMQQEIRPKSAGKTKTGWEKL